LVFDNKSTEAIKMNYLKTLICGGFVGAREAGKISFVNSRAVNVEGN